MWAASRCAPTKSSMARCWSSGPGLARCRASPGRRARIAGSLSAPAMSKTRMRPSSLPASGPAKTTRPAPSSASVYAASSLTAGCPNAPLPSSLAGPASRITVSSSSGPSCGSLGADQPGAGGEGDSAAAGMGGDCGAERVERALAAGVVEAVEHPSHQAEHEAARVAGIGPEPHRPVQRVETDIGEPRGCQQGPGPAWIGEGERAGGARRRGGEVPPGGQCAAELAHPLVRPGALPRQYHQPPAGAQRPADVGERSGRVTEEHGSGARDRRVERPGGEGMDLRVIVGTWPDDPRQATHDPQAIAETVGRARRAAGDGNHAPTRPGT